MVQQPEIGTACVRDIVCKLDGKTSLVLHRWVAAVLMLSDCLAPLLTSPLAVSLLLAQPFAQFQASESSGRMHGSVARKGLLGGSILRVGVVMYGVVLHAFIWMLLYRSYSA